MSIPLHRSREGNPYDRGLAFGRAHKRAVAGSVAFYRRLFNASRGLGPTQILALGREYQRSLVKAHPQLAEEIEGIAEGAGEPTPYLYAVNARTEVLEGALQGECSVVGYGGAGRSAEPWIAQNWDWHPAAASSRVLWEVHLPGGLSFVTLTEAGILAKMGLNSAGFGVLLNLLATDLDGGTDGLPVHLAIRLLLSECVDADEASARLRALRFSASSALTLIDAGGGLATAEVWPRGVNFVEPSARGHLTHTNHFIGATPGARDLVRQRGTESLARKRVLDEAMDAAPEPPGPQAAPELLRSHEGWPLSVCCHDATNPVYTERGATLLSVVLQPQQRALRFSDGAPCTNEFQTYRIDHQDALERHDHETGS